MAETYKELQDEALQFLASAGEYALLESTRLGQEDKTSVNEIVGMALRAIGDGANVMQKMADEEEKHGSSS